VSLTEFTLKCRRCGLRWIVFGDKPGDRCVFCGEKLTRG
jgi:rRNA maturation endonuclease Nob1